MKVGSNCIIFANMRINEDEIESVIFTFKGRVFVTKVYPDNVTYNEGVFAIPLRQEETIHLLGDVPVEAQINYKTGAVQKSDIQEVHFDESIATEIIEGNTPSEVDIQEISFEIIGDVVIAKIGPTWEEVERLDNKIDGVSDKLNYSTESFTYTSPNANWNYTNKSILVESPTLVELRGGWSSARVIGLSISRSPSQMSYNVVHICQLNQDVDVSLREINIRMLCLLQPGTYYVWSKTNDAGRESYTITNLISF